MTCNEAGEFVSALCDGETIPREAADHLDTCKECQARLKDYIEMSAELRRAASAEFPAETGPWTASKRGGVLAAWWEKGWQKGWQSMRIPRFAFALLVAIVAALSFSLAMVRVRAHSEGPMLMLHFSPAPGRTMDCPISVVEKDDACGFMGDMESRILTYDVRILGKDGPRVELGIRATIVDRNGADGKPLPPRTDVSILENLPQERYWFEPGDTLKPYIPGLKQMTVTGEWIDHRPTLSRDSGLDPRANELRMVSPVLLRDKMVAGDMEGGTAVIDEPGQGIDIYLPEEGRFMLSLTPINGAIEARVALNRVSFEDNGRKYEFVTGSPVARSKKLWVLRDPNFKPQDGANGYIGVWDPKTNPLKAPDRK